MSPSLKSSRHMLSYQCAIWKNFSALILHDYGSSDIAPGSRGSYCRASTISVDVPPLKGMI